MRTQQKDILAQALTRNTSSCQSAIFFPKENKGVVEFNKTTGFAYSCSSCHYSLFRYQIKNYCPQCGGLIVQKKP